MEFIEAKTILTPVRYGNEWYGIDYNMNLYKGCSHGCIYCDSRSECYGIHDFDSVKAKKDALIILENELKRKRNKGIIGIGSMSDPYNPQEEKYEYTRGSLKLIHKYGFGVSIDTKSNLILRDLDIISKINEEHNVIVKFTITCANDDLCKKIEPNVCVSSKRFEALKQISDKGIYCGVMMNPVLPFITDNEENIKEIVKKAYECGAKFIYTYMGMTLRDIQKEYYFNKLDEHFLGMKNQYILFYRGKYNCRIPNYEKLYKLFVAECKKYGILYRMNDIINDYKKNKIDFEQVSLF